MGFFSRKPAQESDACDVLSAMVAKQQPKVTKALKAAKADLSKYPAAKAKLAAHRELADRADDAQRRCPRHTWLKD